LGFINPPQKPQIPIAHLTINHRVKKNPRDGIILNARDIIGNFTGFTLADNFLVKSGDLITLKSTVIQLLKQYDHRDICIISPFNNDVGKINPMIQSIVNPKGKLFRDTKGKSWRIGDRVMMTSNNNDIGVYNGEEGYITNGTSKEIEVSFIRSSRIKFLLSIPISPTKKDIHTGLLVMSYCVTVHKKQGDDSKACVMYFPDTGMSRKSSLLNQNLMYTCITRSIEMFILVGHIGSAHAACLRKSPKKIDTLHNRIGVYKN
jgi:exodeoxyribonuclease V alpha subunit